MFMKGTDNLAITRSIFFEEIIHLYLSAIILPHCKEIGCKVRNNVRSLQEVLHKVFFCVVECGISCVIVCAGICVYASITLDFIYQKCKGSCLGYSVLGLGLILGLF